MTSGSRLRPSVFFLLGLALSPLAYAQTPSPASSSVSATAPATNSPAAAVSAGEAKARAAEETLRDAYRLGAQGKFDAALTEVNSVLQTEPQNTMALSLRGNIYTEKKLWDSATKDYQAVLQIDGKNMAARFNLAEIKFRQKDYSGARPGFVALEKEPDLGDLASFKVFLCDLFGHHEDAATKELAAFDQVGGNASYYFAHVAWALYHHNLNDARSWLNSAIHIYSDSPTKINFYTASLRDLGYLPIPPPK